MLNGREREGRRKGEGGEGEGATRWELRVKTGGARETCSGVGAWGAGGRGR